MKTSQKVEDFLTYLVTEKGDNITTIHCYQKDLSEFYEYLNDKEVENLTSDDMNDFLSHLSNKGMKNNTIIRKSMAIKGFYKYLRMEGVISVSLTDLVTPKKESRLPVTLSLEEVTKLLDQPSRDTDKGLLDHTMILLCFSCGLRVSELVGLRIDRINHKNGFLRIFGKRNKERLVPISQGALNAVSEYEIGYRKSIKTTNKNLFLHPDGSLVSRQYFFLELKKYSKMAGIEKNVSPHTLRHTYATLLLENGAKLRNIQELLGHQDISTTQIYTHISKKKQVEEYHSAMPRK